MLSLPRDRPASSSRLEEHDDPARGDVVLVSDDGTHVKFRATELKHELVADLLSSRLTGDLLCALIPTHARTCHLEAYAEIVNLSRTAESARAVLPRFKAVTLDDARSFMALCDLMGSPVFGEVYLYLIETIVGGPWDWFVFASHYHCVNFGRLALALVEQEDIRVKQRLARFDASLLALLRLS
ncbi:hypothetical protein Q5752_006494 [Cryptotrichosporon argae]